MRTSMRRTWKSCATLSRRTSKWGARLIWLGPSEFTLGSGFNGLPHPEKPENPPRGPHWVLGLGVAYIPGKIWNPTPTAQERVIAPVPGLSVP